MPSDPTAPLIVFSHLRWSQAYQRAQHLLPRLATRRRVCFVEPPAHAEGPARLARRMAAPGVELLRPHTPVPTPGFHDAQVEVLGPLLAQAWRDEGLAPAIGWFCTPAALPLLPTLDACGVVYDCSGDLFSPTQAHLHATPQPLRREAQLLDRAQLVLTSGPSLYQAKRAVHPNVLCLPGGVDAAHFSAAAALARPEAMLRAEALQGRISGPRLGFYGAIDERVDLALLERLARAEPAWQFVMVGPLRGLDAAQLPREPNIHWLGEQPHELLPQLVAGWDVCLLPFALNDATRFLGATKTLEYLAAEKPVVSTPVHDVVALYGEVVRIAADTPAFLAACHAALDETIYERGERLGAAAAAVARHSWEHMADRVLEALDTLPRATAAPAHPRQADPPAPAVLAAARPAAAAVQVHRARHVVIGAGATGLAAAWRLGLDGDPADTLLIERESAPGGLCRSLQTQGFTFDLGGRVLFSNEPAVLELYDTLLGDNLHWQTLQTAVHGSAQPAPGGAGALDPSATALRPGARFGYPLVGGLQALTDALHAAVRCPIALNTRVLQVSPDARTLRLDDGRSLHYDTLIATLPLPELVAACGAEAPPALHTAARQLRRASLRCVQLGVVREHVSDAHWVHYPAGAAVFQRVFMQTNASPHCSPPGAFGLVCEITHGPEQPLPCDGLALIARVRADCVKVGLLRDDDTLLVAQQTDLPGACVQDDAQRAERVALIRDWLADHGILTAGPYGEWAVAGEALHPFIAGQRAAQQALAMGTWVQVPQAG